MSEESLIRGRCREMERLGGRNRGEGAGWIFSLQNFVSVVQWSFSSFGKTLHFCLFLLLLHSPVTHFFSPSVHFFAQFISSVLHLSLCPNLFHHSSNYTLCLLSMASTLYVPPPVFFRLFSPRMHLFKACFTKTVLRQKKLDLELVKVLKFPCWHQRRHQPWR